MSYPWTVKEHVIPASHPRGFRRGVRDPQKSLLRLHVKQYIPISIEAEGDHSKTPDEKAITIIFHHGAGGTKEPYEPFLADLLATSSCPPIRSIWSLDAANHGQSFRLNESEIGDEPHWFDTAHDVKQLINVFQNDMPPPLVGMGFSWGCNSMLLNASWHPRIFQALICMEPTVETGWWHGTYASRNPRILALARRRHKWQSREAARKELATSPIYVRFDPRVFDKVIQYDLTDIPKSEGGGVTFTTPKSQEVAVYARPDPPLPDYPTGEEYETRLQESLMVNGFYRSEVSKVKELIGAIHCKTLLMWSVEDDWLSSVSYRERLKNALGTGLMGGGGKEKGQVDESFVGQGRHTFLFDNPKESGAIVAGWLMKVVWPMFLQEEFERSKEPLPKPRDFQQGWLQRMEEVRPTDMPSKL
jgi:pimeloyl-ACP methyl ester carboxylesterase